jgi:hypothetical protein
MTDYPSINFRAGTLLPALVARSSSEQSRHATAQRDLDRYYTLLARSLPTFTEAEASLLMDALNGTIAMPQTAHLLWAEIDDAIRLDRLDEKWGVDGQALHERLRALTPFQAMAILDAKERYWLHPNEPDALQRVGLVKQGACNIPYSTRADNSRRDQCGPAGR